MSVRQKQVEFVVKRLALKFPKLCAWPFSVFIKLIVNEILEVSFEQFEFHQIKEDVEKQRIALEGAKTDAEIIENSADFITLK